jgi:PhnB protein
MAQVKAVPEGYHTLTPFLCVKGAAKLIDFCKQAFGAEERVRMAGPNNTIMHAELKIGDSCLMVTDAIEEPARQGSIHVYVNDVDTVFNKAVAAGAQVKMPLADMFWGDRFGRVTDPFGNNWSLAQHKEDVAPAEMQKRMQAETARGTKK